MNPAVQMNNRTHSVYVDRLEKTAASIIATVTLAVDDQLVDVLHPLFNPRDGKADDAL